MNAKRNKKLMSKETYDKNKLTRKRGGGGGGREFMRTFVLSFFVRISINGGTSTLLSNDLQKQIQIEKFEANNIVLLLLFGTQIELPLQQVSLFW